MRARIDLVTRVEPVVRGVVSDRLGVPADAPASRCRSWTILPSTRLDLLEIVIDLESAFTIVIPEREIDRVRTIADLAELVAEYVWERDHAEPFPAATASPPDGLSARGQPRAILAGTHGARRDVHGPAEASRSW